MLEDEGHHHPHIYQHVHTYSCRASGLVATVRTRFVLEGGGGGRGSKETPGM